MENIIYNRKSANPVDIIVLSHNALEVNRVFISNLYQFTNIDDYNLIWIDNASIDGTLDLLKDEFKNKNNVTLVSSDVNLGVIGGRNKGYEISCNKIIKSDFIMFLDNDQFVRADWLVHHLSVLSHGYDIVGVEAWRLGNNCLPVENIQTVGKPFSYVGCGGMLIKRCVTDKIGMFDDNFNPCYFEDPDFCIRAIKEGFKIGWNAKAKITHLPHQTLGKMGSEEKTKKFLKSLKIFREKWAKQQLPLLQQINLPEFGNK